MKTIARTAAAVTTAVIAALASMFVAAPAFASEEGGEKFNPAAQFSTAGDPLQVGAILICGAILLVIVLLLAQLIGSSFDPKKN